MENWRIGELENWSGDLRVRLLVSMAGLAWSFLGYGITQGAALGWYASPRWGWGLENGEWRFWGRPAGEVVGGSGDVGLVGFGFDGTQGAALGWYASPRWGWGLVCGAPLGLGNLLRHLLRHLLRQGYEGQEATKVGKAAKVGM